MESDSNGGVMFVGLRRGAILAAARLGMPVTLLHDEPIPTSLRQYIQRAKRIDRGEEGHVMAAARELAGPRRVLAMTERSVVLAARIRAELGLGGTDMIGASCCHDKAVMKRTLREAGVVVTDWEEVDVDSDPARLLATFGVPLVLKPRTSSGSRGLVMAGNVEEARAGLHPLYLAERFVHGVEMSVDSLRAEGQTIFTNFTAYHEPLWASVVPAEVEAATRALILDVNERALDALGVQRGLCHLELFLHADGPVVGEVAIRPPGGYLMRLIELAYGFDPWEALLRVVVREERPALPTMATACAAARIFHPGPGVVEAVHGAGTVRAWPETVDLKVRVRAGSRVQTRMGSGAECAHLLLRGADRAAVVRRLDEAPKAFRIALRGATQSSRRS